MEDISPSDFKFSDAARLAIEYAAKKAVDYRNRVIESDYILYGAFRVIGYRAFKNVEWFKEFRKNINYPIFKKEISDLIEFLENEGLKFKNHFQDFLRDLQLLFNISINRISTPSRFPSFTEKKYIYFLVKAKKNQLSLKYGELTLSLLIYQVLTKPSLEVEYLFSKFGIELEEFVKNLKNFIYEKSPDIDTSSLNEIIPINYKSSSENNIFNAREIYQNAYNQFYIHSRKFYENLNYKDYIEIFKEQIKILKKANKIWEKKRHFKELLKSYKLLARFDRILNGTDYLSYYKKSLIYAKKLRNENEELRLLEIIIQEQDKCNLYRDNIVFITAFFEKYETNVEMKIRIQSKFITEFYKFLGYAYYNINDYENALKNLKIAMKNMSFSILNEDYQKIVENIIEIYKKLNNLEEIKKYKEKLGLNKKIEKETKDIMMDSIQNNVVMYIDLIIIQHLKSEKNLFLFDRKNSITLPDIALYNENKENYEFDALSALFSAIEILKIQDKNEIKFENKCNFEGDRYILLQYPQDGIRVFCRNEKQANYKLVSKNIKLIIDKFLDVYSNQICRFRGDIKQFNNFIYILKKPFLFLDPKNPANWFFLGKEYEQFNDKVNIKKAIDCFHQCLELDPKNIEAIRKIKNLDFRVDI